MPCRRSGSNVSSLMKPTAAVSVGFDFHTEQTNIIVGAPCPSNLRKYLHCPKRPMVDTPKLIFPQIAPAVMAGLQIPEGIMYASPRMRNMLTGGNDFRPDYKKLGILKQQFPDVPILALTATATHRVRRCLSSYNDSCNC